MNQRSRPGPDSVRGGTARRNREILVGTCPQARTCRGSPPESRRRVRGPFCDMRPLRKTPTGRVCRIGTGVDDRGAPPVVSLRSRVHSPSSLLARHRQRHVDGSTRSSAAPRRGNGHRHDLDKTAVAQLQTNETDQREGMRVIAVDRQRRLADLELVSRRHLDQRIDRGRVGLDIVVWEPEIVIAFRSSHSRCSLICAASTFHFQPLATTTCSSATGWYGSLPYHDTTRSQVRSPASQPRWRLFSPARTTTSVRRAEAATAICKSADPAKTG